MGKLLILSIVVIAAIITTILLSVQDVTNDTPDLLSQNLTELQAKQLCQTALHYGEKKINDAGSSAIPTTHMQTFVNFDIGDGIIDSIQYETSNDTVIISSYATYNNGNDTFQHKSSSLLTWATQYGVAAVIANGPIDVSGSAVVNGNTIQNVDPQLNFEEFFGMTKAQMRAIADYNLVNPHPNPDPDPGLMNVSGITYVTAREMKVTTSSWAGTGILVIDGNARFNGGSFTGVIWVTGTLIVTGNEDFFGAVYIEGRNMGGGMATTVSILGDSVISYDESAIILALGHAGQILTKKLKVLSIHEDD